MNNRGPKKSIRILLGLLCLLIVAGVQAIGHAEDLGVVTGGKLHLRTAASMQSDTIATYPSGTYVTITGSSDGWYQVETADGKTGYMDASYIRVATVGVVENGSDYVNLRSKPSREAGVLGEYESGTHVTLLSETGTGWMYVAVDDKQGYMDAEFIQPAPEGETPVTITVNELGNGASPYELPTNGENSVIHQFGQSESEQHADDKLVYTIYYPLLGLEDADAAIKNWVDTTIADVKTQAQDAQNGVQVELTVQYDTYLVANRYVGVLETGFLDSAMYAHPTDLIYTLNVDQQSGAMLTWQDIFATERTDDVLAMLKDKLSQLDGNPASDVQLDATWLDHALLTPEGVAVILPRSDYLASVYGTQSITLTYQELAEAQLLAIDVTDVPMEQAATPAPTAAPQQGAREIDPTKPMIALTFDDGPSDYTLKILGLLEANGAKATFCMVGNRIENYHDVVAQVAAQGSEIATHTWAHKQLTKLSPDAIESQLARSMDAVTAVTGQPVTVMRPPYGSVNKEVRDVARNLGLTIVTWSIDTEDWKTNNADSTYHAIMDHVKNGSIILCHDVKSSTSVAMERVIPELVERGYQLLTVSELLSFSETHGEAGVVYNHLDTSHLEGGA